MDAPAARAHTRSYCTVYTVFPRIAPYTIVLVPIREAPAATRLRRQRGAVLLLVAQGEGPCMVGRWLRMHSDRERPGGPMLKPNS
eukprot:COSAG02_NODE_996_length_15338_cov_3.867577_9_plen_85_part_00